ncbi:hypothetical protein [Kitasatospora sp. NBC_00315]|uniref:DUF7144 family membrane protein n=1 Tax=Kitasatospora sp. NBC_00315 TaxID=2975963 RepID=UPI00325126E9
MSPTSRPTPSTRKSAASGSFVAGGLAGFAAVMLLLAGSLAVLRGIMGIAEDDVFVSTPNYVFKFDLTSWGWIHLVLGVIAIAVAAGLFKRALWARVIGVAVAVLLIIANFLSIPYYPAWSVTVMAVCAFVIWGLCVVRPDET